MNETAPIVLVVALVLAISAAFFNFGGPAPAAGQPWYRGRLTFHTGWAAFAFYLAFVIWGGHR